MRSLCIIFLVLLCLRLSCQTRSRLDSLYSEARQISNDTPGVNTLNNLSKAFIRKNRMQSADSVLQIAKTLAERIDYRRGLARTLANLGYVNFMVGDLNAGLKNDSLAAGIHESLGDEKGLSLALNNLGLVHFQQGDYPRAMEIFLRALAICERMNNVDMMAALNSNIGNIYYDKEEHENALRYYLRSTELYKSIGHTDENAGNLHNIGVIYTALWKKQRGNKVPDMKTGLLKKSLESLNEARRLNEASGNKNWLANNLMEMAELSSLSKDYKAVEEYYRQALQLSEEVGNTYNTSFACLKLALVFDATGRLNEAEKILGKGIVMAEQIRAVPILSPANLEMAQICKKRNQYELALEYYKKYVLYKDSIFNADKSKAITRSVMTYEFEKRTAATKAEQDKKDAVKAAESKKQRYIITLAGAALLLVMVFLVLVSRALRITRKQQAIIEVKNLETQQQKDIIEQKNNDILSSIHYARRIQQSLLPTDKYISRNLEGML